VNGLVCLYTLAQSLTLTVVERRGTVAVLRASGAGRAQVASLLAGSAALVAVLATPLGVVLERVALSPAVAGLAADYAELPLGAGPTEIAVLVLGVAVLAAAATALVARRATRESIVAGLREG
jgi:ABC-type antimicrobial peptide transport system permease subunit